MPMWDQRTLAALLHGLIAFRSPKSGYVRVRFYENEVTTGAFISQCVKVLDETVECVSERRRRPPPDVWTR